MEGNNNINNELIEKDNFQENFGYKINLVIFFNIIIKLIYNNKYFLN